MANLIIVEDSHELAELIASMARARGHAVEEVYTGKSALALIANAAFDVAVVDLLLPDLNGSHVLKLLRERKIPAIAISGVFKGARFAQESTQVHGARAFFEKPFELAALLDAVDEAVGRPAARAHRPEQEPSVFEEVELGEPFVDPDVVGVEQWEQAWKSAKKPGAPPPKRAKRPIPEWAQAGDLAKTSVPRLLNAYYLARHTGELGLRQGKLLKVVAFEDGQPIFAASNAAHERFAGFCSRRGLLTPSHLGAMAALTMQKGMRTGEAMVQIGLIDAEQRKLLLEDQAKEIIWSTFGWTEGDYTFLPGKARPSEVRLKIFPGKLILEGILHGETLASLQGKVPPHRRFYPSEDPPYELHELGLTGSQAQLIAHADGSKTIAQLLGLSKLPELEALATLRSFELLGMLEERGDDGTRRKISFGL